MGKTLEGVGMGWVPDYPDFRDYSVGNANIDELHAAMNFGGKSKSKKALKASLAAAVDLRQWCPPIENQGALGSCTANAGVGVMEYFERRAFGRHVDASRLFVYKTTRKLMGWTGDTGAYLRSTMGALAVFGAPPEKYWPYDIARFEEEPPAFCYAFGQGYQAVKYFRHDPPGTAPAAILDSVKTHLAAGVPSMFGFTVYSSISQANATGKIPFPAAGEQVEGGHAIVAVGYDDAMQIKNTSPGGVQAAGALLIRNSWGAAWGDQGYGWLPYEYVKRSLAVDWWSLLSKEWVDTGQFGF